MDGSYSGTGTFAASAQTGDELKSSKTSVSGSPQGSLSVAQSHGGREQAQTQVSMGLDGSGTSAISTSQGLVYGTNTQVQAGLAGGVADAQSRGPGATASQAQIGFLPRNQDQPNPYRGGGTATSQSGPLTGSSTAEIEGSYRYGISYKGAAQAASGRPLPQSTMRLQAMKAFNESQSVEEQYRQENNSSSSASEGGSSSGASRTLTEQEVEMLARQTAGHHIVFNETLTISTLNETVTFDSTNREVLPTAAPSTPSPAIPTATGSDDDSSKEPNSLRGDTTFTPPRQQASTPAPVGGGGVEDFDEYEDYEDEEETEFDDNHQQGQRPPKYLDGAPRLPERGDLFSARPAPKAEMESIPQQTSVKDSVKDAVKDAVKGKVAAKKGKGKKNLLRQGGRRSNNRSLVRSGDTVSGPVPEGYISVTKSVTGQLPAGGAAAPGPGTATVGGEAGDPKTFSHTYFTAASACGFFSYSCNEVSGAMGKTNICKPGTTPTKTDGTPC